MVNQAILTNRLLVQIEQLPIRLNFTAFGRLAGATTTLIDHARLKFANLFNTINGFTTLGLPTINVEVGLLLLKALKDRIVVLRNLGVSLIAQASVQAGLNRATS